LGSLTIDARGGNGDKGHDGVTEERASKTLSDGDGTYKSIAPVRAATAGGTGGNGGNGGNITLTYSTADFIPIFNQSRKKKSIILLYKGGTGGKPGRFGKINGQNGTDGKVRLININQAINTRDQ
jgi:hypothetical protein